MRWLDERVGLAPLVAGVAADWAGTVLTAGVLGAAFGVTADNHAQRAAELMVSPAFLAAATAHGSLFTALGGFVAARLAPGDELRHAAIVGVLAIVVGLVLGLSPGDAPRPAWWVDGLGFLLAVPAAAGGGWLSRYLRRGW